MFDINNIIRKNIRELSPYSSARAEFSGKASIWLDANENPFDTEVNRYPDPFQIELKKTISEIKGLPINQVFIGNGSDEAIDLLFRAFCEPQLDKTFLFPPTYAMYEVSAKINNVEIVNLMLTDDFALPNIADIKEDINSKGLLFICTPNNPTGNIYPLNAIKEIADNFKGLVVVDEAYIDFSNTESAISLLNNTPNIVVLQTMSKAYGLAGLRLGMAFANSQIIETLTKIKAPYNINTLSQRKGIEMLKREDLVKQRITQVQSQRDLLILALQSIKSVKKIYPTQANFILVEFKNTETVFAILRNKGIIIRDRTRQIKDCLRITVGTPEQNKILIETLKKIV